ncbi:hypothetical protein VINI7043_05571 [Vibrio nigripulchritudo ATCC 27043]|uniref:hypothetical protein n=1 Tax=Vibrio nigripulchritudo TaxID=28173 RepID=UPI00021C1BB6|nr:hypothetical protein [Vibrio nigripulchritudo]EGU59893.1 hypothetical protein VINI7043_05571 [Vibrio nigripulchritudo ATCC 27043]
MTYNNLNSLVSLLQSQPELPVITTALVGMLNNGYKQNSLSATIRSFTRSKDLPEEYEDDLDDLIAAMGGWCDKDFALHPSHFEKKKP